MSSSKSYTEYIVRRIGTNELHGPTYRVRECAEIDLDGIQWSRPEQQFEVAERQVTVSDWRSSPRPDEEGA